MQETRGRYAVPPRREDSTFRTKSASQPMQWREPHTLNPLTAPAHFTLPLEASSHLHDDFLDIARTFAQRVLCAAAMRSRAATDSWRFMPLPGPDEALDLPPLTLLSCAITFSSCLSSPSARLRSSINCSRTASRSAMHAPFRDLLLVPEDTRIAPPRAAPNFCWHKSKQQRTVISRTPPPRGRKLQCADAGSIHQGVRGPSLTRVLY
jgi:hypothetical protein